MTLLTCFDISKKSLMDKTIDLIYRIMKNEIDTLDFNNDLLKKLFFNTIDTEDDFYLEILKNDIGEIKISFEERIKNWTIKDYGFKFVFSADEFAMMEFDLVQFIKKYNGGSQDASF